MSHCKLLWIAITVIVQWFQMWWISDKQKMGAHRSSLLLPWWLSLSISFQKENIQAVSWCYNKIENRLGFEQSQNALWYAVIRWVCWLSKQDFRTWKNPILTQEWQTLDTGRQLWVTRDMRNWRNAWFNLPRELPSTHAFKWTPVNK